MSYAWLTWWKMRDMRRAEASQVIPVKAFLDQLIPTTYEWSQPTSAEPYSQLSLTHELNAPEFKFQDPLLVKATFQSPGRSFCCLFNLVRCFVKFAKIRHLIIMGYDRCLSHPRLHHHTFSSWWHCSGFSLGILLSRNWVGAAYS